MKHKKYKESGRVMALLLSVVLMLGLLPLPVRAAGAETGVHLGDYIRLGSYDGEPISIGFKSTFLVEILSNMDTPTVVVELADSTRAGVFKPVYDDKQTSATLMLLMPMMINA